MNLYEINTKILECIDTETGEIIDEEMLDALEMEKASKIENIALWIKNILAESEAIKAEKNALAERERAAKNKAESLKRYLFSSLSGKKFSTPRVSISYRRSKSVEADVDEMVKHDGAEHFLKYSDPVPDKKAIKEAIESGVDVPGCRLVEKSNIQIK